MTVVSAAEEEQDGQDDQYCAERAAKVDTASAKEQNENDDQ